MKKFFQVRKNTNSDAESTNKMLIKSTFTKLFQNRVLLPISPGEIIKDTPQKLWDRFSQVSGTTEEHLLGYLHDLDEAYAIEITNLKTFDEPFIPEDIKSPQAYKYIDFDLKE